MVEVHCILASMDKREEEKESIAILVDLVPL